MKHIKLIFILTCLLAAFHSMSAIHYVGQGPQCNGVNHHDSLDAALVAALFNGSQNDEIRLTPTGSYTGNVLGTTNLSGWNASTAGELIIAGGYADCGVANSSGVTVIGNTSSHVFLVDSQSVVTFKNISMTGSDSRGLIVDQESVVYLESVDISSNVAGIRALGGSYVSVDVSSVVSSNGDLDDIPKGGGIWCFGGNTEVEIAGTVSFNQATSGGNIYVEDGCYLRLQGGSRIKGSDSIFAYNAFDGGGIMVHDGGTLFANGGADRVLITDHWAFNDGGAIYVHGTGRATLLNTYIANNFVQSDGAGLFAVDGGTVATQVTMDRAASCPFLISCSEFEGNDFSEDVVHVVNSKVKIQRTLFDNNQYITSAYNFNSLVKVRLGGVLQMSHINMINNDARFLIESFGSSELSHITAVGNYTHAEEGGLEDSFVWFSSIGSLRLENSIFQDTQGGQNAPTTSPNISGKCNLIDHDTDWPVGSYTIGTATFINVAGGDARQQASSDGVDMCLEDTFAWSTNRDIEYQVSPVNENTNPQGMPGEAGGLYDAGFDEVYDNIGDDQFLLTVQKEGSGEGFVISDPLGISCGSDCTEVVFNGTLVTLTATALSGSDFIGWLNCPLASGNECFITVTESATVRAEFQPDDLIFSDDFE